MINAGAIAAVSLIPGSSPDERFAAIQEFYSAFAGRRLDIDHEVYASEKAAGSRNRAIAYMLLSFGVLGGIIAVLPGQLGIGVYSPLLDVKGNGVRGVRLCRSLSEQLGLHFLNVSRDSRSTLRAVYEPSAGIRVYESHGDLLFSGAEQVARTIDRDRENAAVVILDVSRVDDIDDAARDLLAGTGAALRAEGRYGYVVDPRGIVIRDGSENIVFRHGTVDDAVAAAEKVRGETPS